MLNAKPYWDCCQASIFVKKVLADWPFSQQFTKYDIFITLLRLY